MDVKAKIFADYSSVEELRELLTRYKDERLLHIGQGSSTQRSFISVAILSSVKIVFT